MPYIPKVQASESCKLLFLQCKKNKKQKQIKKQNNSMSQYKIMHSKRRRGKTSAYLNGKYAFVEMYRIC